MGERNREHLPIHNDLTGSYQARIQELQISCLRRSSTDTGVIIHFFYSAIIRAESEVEQLVHELTLDFLS